MKNWVKMITTLMMTKSLAKLILDYIYSRIPIVCSCTWNSTLLKWNIETLVKTDGLREKFLPFSLYLPWMFCKLFYCGSMFQIFVTVGTKSCCLSFACACTIVFSWDLSGLHSWMPCGRQVIKLHCSYIILPLYHF